MELINKGKVKGVYAVNDKELEFLFSDRISVFDQIIPSEIPDKGESLCRESAFWFKKVEDMGVKTHFISIPSGNKMRVRRVNVIHDYNKMGPSTTNYQLPLELILRWYCAGSFYKGVRKDPKVAESAGFEHGYILEYGEKLPEPFFEQTTKFEPTDRKLTEEEAMKISGLSKRELDNIKEICINIDEMIQKEVGKRGLIHVDGKKEFALDENREPVVIDTFGTADEDRWWDATEYKKGNCVEYSKEFVRKYYENEVFYDLPEGKMSHKEALDMAREKGTKEPPIPALPENMIQKTSELYENLYQKITGEAFKR